MVNLGYYNGKYGPLDEMTVPMNDRVCYFGDGVYDATYARNHLLHDLEPHMDRFYRSAALIDIKIEPTKEQLMDTVREMVGKVDDGNQFVYWQVTRGTALRNHVYPVDTTSNIWIMIKPGTIKDPGVPVKLITVEDTRYFHCNIKTLNLLPNIMAAQRAELAGCGEVVFHRGERVTECSHSNVHIIKDGVFRTAPADNLILPGIARANLITMCGRLGIPVNETAFTVSELMDADEVMISSAGTVCLAASHIDGLAVGGRAPELLKALQGAVIDKFMSETGGV